MLDQHLWARPSVSLPCPIAIPHIPYRTRDIIISRDPSTRSADAPYLTLPRSTTARNT
jgi:hypothetical protein